jgi:hypothetical protein
MIRAVFAMTAWTSLYFPGRWLLRGDMTGMGAPTFELAADSEVAEGNDVDEPSARLDGSGERNFLYAQLKLTGIAQLP